MTSAAPPGCLGVGFHAVARRPPGMRVAKNVSVALAVTPADSRVRREGPFQDRIFRLHGERGLRWISSIIITDVGLCRQRGERLSRSHSDRIRANCGTKG